MGESGGSVRIWDVARGERIGGDLAAHKTVTDLTLTADKKFLVTGGDDGEVKIWDLAKRQLIRAFPAHKQKIAGFAMSPDGARFATLGEDQDVKLWDLASGKELRKWTGVAKCHAWYVARDQGWTGLLWAKRSKATPIKDRRHQENVFRYICDHVREGAWVWTFRMPWPVSSPRPQSPPAAAGGL